MFKQVTDSKSLGDVSDPQIVEENDTEAREVEARTVFIGGFSEARGFKDFERLSRD